MKLFVLMAHINVGMFLVRFVGCHIKRTMLALALVPSQHEQHWIDGLTFPRLELFKWFEWPVWELRSDWSWNLYRTDQSDVLADILGSKRWMHLVNCWYRLDRRILMRKRGVSTALPSVKVTRKSYLVWDNLPQCQSPSSKLTDHVAVW